MKRISLPLICFIGISFIVLATALIISEARFRVALSGTDFRGQYTGAFMAAHGIRDALYDTTRQFVWQHKFLPELTPADLMVYSYHPLVALALSPLGLLSFGTAYRVALALNFILLIYTMKLSARILNPDGKHNPFPHLFAVYTFFLPVWFALLQNQFSFLMYIMLYFLWKWTREKRSVRAGLLLSALIIKPHMLVIPLIVFALSRNWKLIKGFLLGSFGILLATVTLFGTLTIKNYVGFLLLLSNAGDAYTIHTAQEPTIKGILHWISNTDKLPSEITLVYAVIFFAFIVRLIILKKAIKENTASFDAWFGSVILATLLTSPHTNYHDLTLILFVLFLLFRYLVQNPRYKNLHIFPVRRKLTFYLLCFAAFGLTASWVFYPSVAAVSMFALFLQMDYAIRHGHLCAFTKRSISERK